MEALRVVLISEKDAANISLGKISTAFIKNGDSIRLYATYLDDRVLIYFDKSIPRFSIKELTQAEIDLCDIIVCATLASTYIPENVFFAHKPIFTHNYLMNRQINWGGDICFAPTQATVASDYDEFLNYSYISIGEPKYDGQEYLISDKKRFLFIDSGHYPFSYEGKNELAKTLVHICEKYPDYELWIKPRFLPGDKVITHRNDIHLYDIIRQVTDGNIPSNMVMLDYHEDLRKLINESRTVICMYTTAFVGAVVAGKGLIVLENLKSKDVYDIRHKTYMRNRENIVPSGALINYHEVDRLLPDGAKGTEEYLDFLLEEKDHVAEKIVEVCHYLYAEYYSKGLFPIHCDSTYKRYKTDYVVDEGMTWEKQVTLRCYDYILLKSLILIDFHVDSKLDVSYVLQKAHECIGEDGLIHKKTFRKFLANVNDYRDKCIIVNRDILLRDNIDAGVLLNAYYLQKKFDEIRNFPLQTIAAYDMYRAYVAVDTEEDDYEIIAKNCLLRYFEKCIDREYNLEISDMSNNKFRAYITLIDILKKENGVEKVDYYLEKLKDYYMRSYLINSMEEVVTDPLQKSRLEYIRNIEEWMMENE